jgi:chaperonin GroEL (HSP60 family)
VFIVFDLKSSFVGAIAVADLVKTTLGPKGMVNTIMKLKKRD